MVESIEEAMQNLRVWTAEQTTTTAAEATSKDIFGNLDTIVELLTSEDRDDKKALAERLVRDNVTGVLSAILHPEGRSHTSDVTEKAAEVVAELSKIEVGRKHCSQAHLIESLLELLSDGAGSLETLVQSCRALGNVCYDNDYGRSIVHEHGGEEKLLQFLKSSRIAGEDDEHLRTVATGFLLNLINTYAVTQDRFLSLDIITTLCDYLLKYGQEEDVCIHVIMIMNCIADCVSGRKKITEKNICGALVRLMEKEVTPEVVEAVLELIGNIAEDDVVKHQLATTNLCPNLIKLLKTEQYIQEEDSLNVTKVACDLIVLLLTGDESMEYLYGNGQGVVYREMVEWLSSKDDTLQTAAALGIGNFARKDEHCIRMVADGVAGQLLDLLKSHNTKDGDIRMQHAILSSLRNLAIPGANKDALLNGGAIDILLPMIHVETFPVVFKLLATMRMLIDGREKAAVQLGENENCLTRLAGWCNTEDHPGVKGEANRLQASVIKNSKSPAVIRLFAKYGGLNHLVTMAASEHEVMQNEALVALNLICATVSDELDDKLLEYGLLAVLQNILSSESIQAEVKHNALTLIVTILKKGKLKEDVRKTDIPQLVQVMSNGTAAADKSQQPSLNVPTQLVLQLLESG